MRLPRVRFTVRGLIALVLVTAVVSLLAGPLVGGRCPRCWRGEVLPIVYGFPGPRLREEARRGRVVPGGIQPVGARWYCRRCGDGW